MPNNNAVIKNILEKLGKGLEEAKKKDQRCLEQTAIGYLEQNFRELKNYTTKKSSTDSGFVKRERIYIGLVKIVEDIGLADISNKYNDLFEAFMREFLQEDKRTREIYKNKEDRLEPKERHFLGKKEKYYKIPIPITTGEMISLGLGEYIY